MIKLLGLEYNETVIFDKAFLPLDRKGVTQIRGQNKDSKLGLKDPNAAGKSVLLKGIPEIILAASPLTQAIKTKARADLFTSPDSFQKLSVDIAGTKLDIIKKAKAKTFEYEVIENNKNTNIRRKDYTEKKIRSLFDITEDEFFTLWFIDSRRPNSLQFGTAAKRLEFFTNMFRLDDVDSIRKIFNSMLREATLKKAEYDTLNKQLDEVKDVDKVDIEKLTSKIDTIKKSRDSIIQDLDNLSSLLSTLTEVQSNQKLFKRYCKVAKHLSIDLAKTTKVEKEIEFTLEQIQSVKQQATEYALYLKEYAKYKEQSTAIRKKLKAYKDAGDYKSLQKEVHTIESKIKELKKVRQPDDAIKKKYNKAKNLKIEPLKEIEREITHLNGMISVQETLLEVLESTHSKTCFVCGSKTNVSKDTVTEAIKKYKEDLRAWNVKLSQVTDLERVKQEYKKYKEEAANYETSIKNVAKYSKRLTALKKECRIAEEKYELESKLKGLTEPKKLSRPNKTVKYTDSHILLFKEVLRSINLIHPLIESLLEYKDTDTKAKIEDTKKRIKKLNSITQDDEYQSLVAQVSEYKFKSKQKKKLEKQIEKLQTYVDDIEILKVLIETYSNKGLKLDLIRFIAKRIEDNMNKNAPLIFPEPIKFSFNLVSQTSFSITAKKEINGTLRESDVHTLSGAESRAFNMLLPLSMLPLIPDSRRLNTLVLDEPLQNTGEARVDLFINQFIPKLRKVIPHIIILSTDDEYYKDSEIYYVVKDKSKSKLIKKEDML